MPAVLTIHDTLYWTHPELMSTPLYTGPVKWMETRAARNAAHVITDSEASAVDIRKYLRVPPDRLHVVPLAADPRAGRVAETAAHREPRALASGQRRPHKNWEGLIEALALRRAGVPSAPGHHRWPRRRPARAGRRPSSASASTSSCAAGSPTTSWPPSTAGDARWCFRRSSRVSASRCSRRCQAGVPVLCSDIAGAPRDRRRRRGLVRPARPGVDRRSGAHGRDRPERLAGLASAGLERARLFSWQRVADETLAVFRTALHAEASLTQPGEPSVAAETRGRRRCGPRRACGCRSAAGSRLRPCRREVQRSRAARARPVPAEGVHLAAASA